MSCWKKISCRRTIGGYSAGKDKGFTCKPYKCHGTTLDFLWRFSSQSYCFLLANAV